MEFVTIIYSNTLQSAMAIVKAMTTLNIGYGDPAQQVGVPVPHRSTRSSLSVYFHTCSMQASFHYHTKIQTLSFFPNLPTAIIPLTHFCLANAFFISVSACSLPVCIGL